MIPMDVLCKSIHEALGNGEMSGRDLRAYVVERVGPIGAPAFYALMADLEEAGMVQRWDVEKVVGGQTIRERWYRR
jgi:hypothetical protein